MARWNSLKRLKLQNQPFLKYRPRTASRYLRKGRFCVKWNHGIERTGLSKFPAISSATSTGSAFLIVASECPDREIDIERLRLRVQVATLFPEKMPLYDMVYESRFRRLRQQFRERP